MIVAGVLFVLQALPRTWFNDDAFITFRYAEHLAGSEGFVWNRGGPAIEGSTSLGWTVCLAAGMRLGVDPLQMAHALGLFCGFLALLSLWWWSRRRHWGLPATLVALGFLVLQRQWALWSVSAMETTTASLLLMLATTRLLHELQAVQGLEALPGEPDPRGRRTALAGMGSGLLFAGATLFRPEAPLLHIAAAVGACLAVLRAPAPRQATLRLLLVSGATHAILLVALTSWRLATFGQIFPNPFYVKVGSLQWQRGLVWWLEFVQQNQMAMPLLLLVLTLRWTLRHRRGAAVPAMQIVAWCTWVIAIGGGRWEFRWMVPVLPLFALWIGMMLQAVQESARTPAASHATGLRLERGHLLAWSVCALLLISQGRANRVEFRPFGDVLSADQLMESVNIMGNEAAILGPYLRRDDLLCLGWAGVFPYITDVQHFDPWGLNDREIARRPFDPTGAVFHQRHATWDDVVARNVLLSDAFNHFLFPRPYDGRRLHVVPWVRPGVDIHSVALPEGYYWLFASPRPRAEIEAWLASRGLKLERSVPLPAGLPQIGTDD